eukprot:4068396-Alexandrium_andersonii.AAC.1
MSASLVGSEMCIRDRAKGLSRAVVALSLRRSSTMPSNGWKTGEAIPLPVSYTHLTLPTICSV